MRLHYDFVQALSDSVPLYTYKQDGSLRIQSSLRSTTSDLVVAIDLFGVGPATLHIPGLQAIAQLGLMHFEVVVPISRNESGRCAPVPSSCAVTCQSIHISLEPRALIRASARHATGPLLYSGEEPAAANGSMSEDFNLLVRLVECIPTLKLNLVRVEVDIEDPDVQELGQLSLDNIELQLCDPAIPAAEAGAEQREVNVRTVGVKKAATLSVGTSELQLQCAADNLDEAVRHSILKISRVKVDCYARLAVHADDDEEDEDDCPDPAGMLSVWVTIGGECRGLAVTLSNGACPWVHAIYSELQACLRPDQEPVSRSGSLASHIAVEVET